MSAARLSDRTALVTGASRGIGAAAALGLAREGAHVVLVSRKAEGLSGTAEAIAADEGVVTAGGSARIVPAHVGQPEALEALFATLDAEALTVDVLVNNAGTSPFFGPMLDAPAWAWDKTLAVNLLAPFELSRQVAKRLIAAGRPGSIVNVSSVLGRQAAPLQGIYGVSKAALISLTRTLAVEWGGAGIRVNAVAPGLVQTQLARAMTDNPTIRERFVGRTALGRVGRPDDLAGAVVWLASDDSRYVTGETLVVDGGYTIG